MAYVSIATDADACFCIAIWPTSKVMKTMNDAMKLTAHDVIFRAPGTHGSRHGITSLHRLAIHTLTHTHIYMRVYA